MTSHASTLIQETKSKITPYRKQSELQNELDQLTQNYLEAHPEFIDVAIDKDAALKGKDREEVKAMLHFYPGVIAVAAHERAYELYSKNTVAGAVMARELSEAAHSRTGIDIHPGTKIGRNLFIDHGTADVIGETAIIGDNTQIMHKVTLGNYTNPKEKDPKVLAHRHPEIGSNCFIGVGVEILGNVKVGHNVKILSKAMLHGNNITIRDGVKIGTGAEIEDGCAIGPNVKIGEGAFISKNSGEITQDIPPRSQVFRSNDGKLHIIDSLPVQFQKARQQAHAAEQTYGMHI